MKNMMYLPGFIVSQAAHLLSTSLFLTRHVSHAQPWGERQEFKRSGIHSISKPTQNTHVRNYAKRDKD